jgi:hypothetical protein
MTNSANSRNTNIEDFTNTSYSIKICNIILNNPHIPDIITILAVIIHKSLCEVRKFLIYLI